MGVHQSGQTTEIFTPNLTIFCAAAKAKPSNGKFGSAVKAQSRNCAILPKDEIVSDVNQIPWIFHQSAKVFNPRYFLWYDIENGNQYQPDAKITNKTA